MNDALSSDNQPRIARAEQRVFSRRLQEFLTQLLEGNTPNAGRFCAFCYTPLPAGFERCDNCGQSVSARPPVESLPAEVVEMEQRKLKRESVIVNSFAFLGLGLGLAIFLTLVAIGVLYLDRAFWFFIMSTIIFLLGSRLLAGVLGGIIGDEIGYRSANKRLAEDWASFVARRENQLREE